MKDSDLIRDVIELFLVQYFDTIEMSGNVKSERLEDINYFSVNLTETGYEEDIDKIHQCLSKHLSNWVKVNGKVFDNYVALSNLTIEYLLPEKGGANQNQSKSITLFHVPDYYYANHLKKLKPLSPTRIWLLKTWYNTILRNTIIVSTLSITLILISIRINSLDPNFEVRLAKSFDYVNIASGIIASFALAFITSKVISLRSEKLNRTGKIKELSNQLTYFRSICSNFLDNYTYWSPSNKYYNAYQHANSIKDKITYEDYRYPNYDDDIKYAKYQSHYNRDVSNGVVTLILQMEMFTGRNFLNSGLSFTDFPPNYIYSLNEMENFILFHDSNEIWYCSSQMKIFPEKFISSHATNEILKDINRIYPDREENTLTSELFERLSLDFQYRVIPELFRLIRLNESKLPLTMNYFVSMFILLLAFGIIVPTITYIFLQGIYSFLSVFIVIGIITHILLSLKPILNTENSLNRSVDYY
ncbi:hypothetical protein BFP97_06555 [Roseivirga sp. 4D4]|uniref:hypothetical protein n=1 Tax=Roseivirga sp. 4D4 TaxID=1889784 RepID=UPI0008532AFB|nr:hypothetical protein [Roseivirga sp. 4D4]OEK01191.1 hypothetical protein BFP97_06555 [Roseivirga sp. 4D4]